MKNKSTAINTPFPLFLSFGCLGKGGLSVFCSSCVVFDSVIVTAFFSSSLIIGSGVGGDGGEITSVSGMFDTSCERASST